MRKFIRDLLFALPVVAAGCGAPNGAGERGEQSASAAEKGAVEKGAAVKPGAALVSLADIAPGVEIEMRYLGRDNFTGAPVPGYLANTCLLTKPATEALARVQASLEGQGYGLRVYDCFRPQQAVDAFVDWVGNGSDAMKAVYFPAEERMQLIERGYIADRSGHSRGSTVDLTLVAKHAGGDAKVLDMGTPWDFFDPASATAFAAIPAEAAENRMKLLAAMQAAGFKNYAQEWWHFTLVDEPNKTEYWDVPVQ
ncbi:M15 family metallopeptidase [Biformimicrobium ophioploci]|uniref:D-alanyl-D-alanine dipeptidase n=1 Tax=Biformimicrobium ophioploci TaxID=3036711 RepID=A0ABQ6LXK3_9GAMM|nr:M15 family metallopeptidase [Microbulbifer sp. NKW57]GMG86761.1 M15 family metallopeptidase [Microbulbifer sp. NKW57]